jgi:hypothetical protein
VAGAPIATPKSTDKIVNERRPSVVAKFDVKFTIKKILSVASKEGNKARLKSRLLWLIWAGSVQPACAMRKNTEFFLVVLKTESIKKVLKPPGFREKGAAMNKRKAVTFIKLLGAVSFIFGLTQIVSAQNNRQVEERDTLQQLLNEVRMLRESMQTVQRMNLDTYRSQLLIDRTRVIREDIRRLTSSISENRDAVARIRITIPHNVDEQKLLEDQIKLEVNDSKRAVLEMELKRSKNAVEMYNLQADRLSLHEQEMSSELRIQQTKLDDLESRLNLLERAMDADRERLDPEKSAPVKKP